MIGRLILVAALLCLPGCVRPYFEAPRATLDEATYAWNYPYYAEYCAESEFNKKPGFGVDLQSGGPGGHSVFYLNGVCRARDTLYPEVALCDDPPPERMAAGGIVKGGMAKGSMAVGDMAVGDMAAGDMAAGDMAAGDMAAGDMAKGSMAAGAMAKGSMAVGDMAKGGMIGRGTGFSVNAHFRNANWVATEGRDFFYRGDLAPNEPVTRASYDRTQARAKAMRILDGIVFHEHVFEERPADMPEYDFKYDVSIATDYGVDLARDRYCARVPLDRGRMATVVRYLNGLNAPYRSGEKAFVWGVLRNNCAHLAHNALAAAGLWPEWPINRPLLVAAFSFPVPKNEFVNLMRRTNDLPIDDPDALYDDDQARASVKLGWLPTGPGALAVAHRAMGPNEIYDTRVRLIFYDEPVFGHYQERFDKILAEPRYTDLVSNLMYFSTLDTAILAKQPAREKNAKRAAFERQYRAVIAQTKADADAMLARLSNHAGR